MKYKIVSIATIALIMFSACTNDLDQKIVFNVSASSIGSKVIGDTIIVSKSVPVKFDFSGNPDFINFYSGEPGKEYSKRDLTISPVDETTSVLKFSSMPQYGTIAGTLKVYLSTSFTGLLQNNKALDSATVVSHSWVDITSLCNLPTTSGSMKDAVVPLQDYLGKNITIAFKYKTTQNTSTQPTWEVSNLQIVNTLTSGTSYTFNASSMGFGALDMLSATAPYKITSGSGNWDLSSIAASPSKMRVQSSGAGLPINEDWLISSPRLVNSRTPDVGMSIKAMANRLDSYQYTFNNAGTYKVTFNTIIHNYHYNSELNKIVIIKVL